MTKRAYACVCVCVCVCDTVCAFLALYLHQSINEVSFK